MKPLPLWAAPAAATVTVLAAAGLGWAIGDGWVAGWAGACLGWVAARWMTAWAQSREQPSGILVADAVRRWKAAKQEAARHAGPPPGFGTEHVAQVAAGLTALHRQYRAEASGHEEMPGTHWCVWCHQDVEVNEHGLLAVVGGGAQATLCPGRDE